MHSGGPNPEEAAGDAVGPTGYTGVVSDAWSLYRRNFVALVKLFVPGMLLVFVAAFLWLLASVSMTALLQVAGGILFLTLLPAVVGSLVFLASHVLMTEELLGRDAGPLRAATALSRDRPSVAQASLVATTGAMFFGIFPPLFLISFAWWGPPLVGSAVVLEGKPFPAAWSATRQRVRGHLGKVLLTLTLVCLAFSFVNFFIFAPVVAGLGGLGLTGSFLTFVALALLSAVGLPFVAATTLRLYFDVRARSEDDFGLATLATERTRPHEEN